MKRLLSRCLFSFVCAVSVPMLTAKQSDLLDLLFDDEVEIAIKPSVKQNNAHKSDKEENSTAVDELSLGLYSAAQSEEVEVEDSQEDDDVSPQFSPCSLLDLLLADTYVDTSLLFPDVNQRFYRGQFEVMKLTYIDNSVCDKSMPADIKNARPIDQDILTSEEKAVVEKYYRLTKQKYESPWYMKFINKKIGYGIFAAADIEPGQLIAEYVGILFDKHTYLNTPQNPTFCWNIQPPQRMPNSQLFYVDAITSCNFTRIINHSYTPNVAPVHMHGPDGSRILYVACEKIKKDEQLLVNYGQGYWQNRGEPEDLSR